MFEKKEGPNEFQLQFFKASMGRLPDTDNEKCFAAASLPFSAEDAAHRHITNSAGYANEIVGALLEGNQQEAVERLRDFREEGMRTRGFGKEALTKLQAVGLISELYGESGLNQLSEEELKKAQRKFQELERLPRPEYKG